MSLTPKEGGSHTSAVQTFFQGARYKNTWGPTVTSGKVKHMIKFYLYMYYLSYKIFILMVFKSIISTNMERFLLHTTI